MNLERLLETGAIVAKFGGSGGSGQGSNGSRGGNGNQGGGTGGNNRGGKRGVGKSASTSNNASSSTSKSDSSKSNGSQGGGRSRGGKRGVGEAASTGNNRSSGSSFGSRGRARSAMNSTHPVERTIARTQRMTPEEQRTEYGKGGQTRSSSIDGITDRAIDGAGVSPREMDMAVDAVDAYNTRYAGNRLKDTLSLTGVNTLGLGMPNKAVDALTQPKSTYGADYGYRRAEETQMPGLVSGAMGVTNALGITSVPTSLANSGYSMVADTMLNQDMRNTTLNTETNGLSGLGTKGDGNGGDQVNTTPTQQVATAPVSNAKAAFGYAQVDPDKYANGLMNAKV